MVEDPYKSHYGCCKLQLFYTLTTLHLLEYNEKGLRLKPETFFASLF